jgi:DNA-dependent RNA polymerase auxiliary subunit epsilon
MEYFPLCQEDRNCNVGYRVFDEKLRREELYIEMLLQTEHRQSVETTNGFNTFLKAVSDEFIEFRVTRLDLHCFEWAFTSPG